MSIQAAAERLRRVFTIGANAFLDSDYNDGEFYNYVADKSAIVQAYLAEHPADDAEPLTREWLRGAGYRVEDEAGYEVEDGDVDIWYATRRVSQKTSWIWLEINANGDACFGTYDIPKPVKTRGDLRRLEAALGVT